jgi:hypothetical protein
MTMKRTHEEWLKDVGQLGTEMSEFLHQVMNHKVPDEVIRAKNEEHTERMKQLKAELEAGFR